MYRSKITGMGFHVPDIVLQNNDLKQWMDTSDKWIQERSGIKERHWVSEKEAASDLALVASKKAMAMAGIEASEIDLIVVATISPDYFFPGVANQLQSILGLRTVGTFDIKAACSGFIYGLSIADQFIRTGQHKTVMVVGTEAQSKFIDLSTRGRDMGVLFGDGSGAAILRRSDDESGVLSTHIHSEGADMKNLWMEAPGTSGKNWMNQKTIDNGVHHPFMNGREVFKNAVRRFPEVINEALEANNLSIGDIKLVIPHQANYRISQAVAKRLGVGMDVVYSNIHKYGNTTAASIPIALSEALDEGRIERGDHIILAAFGAGYTWASAAIRW
ncbi:MAG: beta-ketoacyl-ACP synthase III [Candidatus Marinimicrobia bacterium]|jgi:3-oxoacyl-[acyl-carrier-protein] synthase-3|nr:beta-ketoacyl-ACP synthase III [Candidatus Neomarinimicrobiota bacterium]MDP6610968.1 beta-ketoacyl-ACP synthase III [Candidatus Neomarinimicrobiota bacterium]|tara:strand:+ start:2066 stop:3058 length:993 start_codon:yes stop_codon:yes gene_type:complete